MSDEIRARVSRFARQIVDFHLPVLVGLMAEKDLEQTDQLRRASELVTLLRTAQVESSLSNNGRPIPLEMRDDGEHQKLFLNAAMLARVDDGALASALAEPVARVLDISPVSTGLVLQIVDVAQIRGLTGKLSRSGGSKAISVMEINELVRWRLDSFEERLYALVEDLGGWLEAPVFDRQGFVEVVAASSKGWPEWREIKKQAYLQTWLEEVKKELSRSDWIDHSEDLVEMIWESLVISAHSALRRSAQSLRSLSISADQRHLLEVLAGVFSNEEEPIDGSLEAWPTFQELQKAWEVMWREEDAVLGARRRVFRLPDISVFASPGDTMGLFEPKSLPWELPLLCWTTRERDALRDLIGGLEKSLVQSRAQIRIGRLSPEALTEALPLVEDRVDKIWNLQVPTRIPRIPDEFSVAINRAYGAMRSSYDVAFSGLDSMNQNRAMKLARGAYAGYLKSTKGIWKRRLSSIKGAESAEAFRLLVTGIANALEWPIFVDVFEGSPEKPRVAGLPRFTVPAVWYKDAFFAPVWLPVETIGETLGQAPIRVRNVAVGADGEQVRWLGDQYLEVPTLQELRADDLLRSVNEGMLLMTAHKS